MSTTRFESVDAYLAALDPPKTQTIRNIIDHILAEFPELECKLAWNVPQIHRNGKYVFGISAHKRHVTLAPWSAQIIQAFESRLSSYVVFKNCFQIPVDWVIDQALLRDLVRARLVELDRS